MATETEIRHDYSVYVDWRYEERGKEFDAWLNKVKTSTLITACIMMTEDPTIQTARDAKDYLLELVDAIKED